MENKTKYLDIVLNVILFIILLLALYGFISFMTSVIEGKWPLTDMVGHVGIPPKEINTPPITKADVLQLIEDAPYMKACEKKGGTYQKGRIITESLDAPVDVWVSDALQFHDNCKIDIIRYIPKEDLLK